MATTIGHLLHDVLVRANNTKDAQERQKESKQRLIDALASIGRPLKVGGRVVVGNRLIYRPHNDQPLSINPIDCVDIGIEVKL